MIATQVSGTRSEGAWCDRRWGKGTGWEPDECALEKGWTDEQPRRATQVVAMQVNGAGSEGTRRARRQGKEMARQLSMFYHR